VKAATIDIRMLADYSVWLKDRQQLYPGPSCPNRHCSEELSAAEVDSRIHKVLDLKVDPNPGPALPLCKKGLPALGLVCLVLFRWLT
jgi:hypothetical protein